MLVTFSLKDIDEVCRMIIGQSLEKVVLVNGEMGAGKTTLIKQLCVLMGVVDATSSPSFSIVNEYGTLDGGSVFHFDFYRIKSESEAMDMGVDDYLYSGNFCFIEWSERIVNLIPPKHSVINIKIVDAEVRQLEFV